MSSLAVSRIPRKDTMSLHPKDLELDIWGRDADIEHVATADQVRPRSPSQQAIIQPQLQISLPVNLRSPSSYFHGLYKLKMEISGCPCTSVHGSRITASPEDVLTRNVRPGKWIFTRKDLVRHPCYVRPWPSGYFDAFLVISVSRATKRSARRSAKGIFGRYFWGPMRRKEGVFPKGRWV